MAKFKVGDEIRILNNVDSQFNKGTIGVIKSNDGSGNREWEVSVNGTSEWFDDHEIELTESKLTKNQRITALENEVAELKVIVHQLRKPSTDVQEALGKADWERGEVEGVIEFEGKQYKKVDRLAREGDVVIITKQSEHTSAFNINKPYKVFNECHIESDNPTHCKNHYGVYNHGRLVDVYELIVEDKQPPIITVAGETRETTHEEIAELISEPKTNNQLRAEIIEKSKVFVENLTKHINCFNYKNETEYGNIDSEVGQWVYNVEFVNDEKKRTIVALLRGQGSNSVYTRGITKCMPGDVFNEHIGKAIALGRALGLDVSEFEQAVQPTESVIGMEVELLKQLTHPKNSPGSIKIICNEGYYPEGGAMCAIDSRVAECSKIINDTNAQYDFVLVGPAPVEELF